MKILENEVARLELEPDWGARVVSLVDKRLGRDWLVQGPCAGDAGEDAVYAFDQARGWDECFPTVAPCSGFAHGWQRALRDHGDLWGRQWACEATENGIVASFAGDRFNFWRRIDLHGDVVVARYWVENGGRAPFGYLYSQHMLLDLRPGETIACAGVGGLRQSGDSMEISWPDAELHPVRDRHAGIAAKLYGQVDGKATVTVGGSGGRLELAWEQGDAAAMGLWLDYGGWPDGAPMHQIAVEPTTAPVDSLAEGEAVWLAPGERQGWAITIRLLPSPTTGSSDRVADGDGA